MLNHIGVRGTKPAYGIPRDEASRASLEEKLRAAGVKSAAPLVVFCGGGKAATQCWPLERYAAVLARLASETGWEVLGLGTAEENESYRARMLPKFPALRLKRTPLTVPEMFEVFRIARLYIGNDTGPMHVSAAVGCPVAVVMSARNPPGVWDPDVEPRLMIRHRTACEGCFLNECLVEHHRCMDDITVEQVIDQLILFVESLPKQRAVDSTCVELPAF